MNEINEDYIQGKCEYEISGNTLTLKIEIPSKYDIIYLQNQYNNQILEIEPVEENINTFEKKLFKALQRTQSEIIEWSGHYMTIEELCKIYIKYNPVPPIRKTYNLNQKKLTNHNILPEIMEKYLNTYHTLINPTTFINTIEKELKQRLIL